eukprot:UC1_evm1s1595
MAATGGNAVPLGSRRSDGRNGGQDQGTAATTFDFDDPFSATAAAAAGVGAPGTIATAMVVPPTLPAGISGKGIEQRTRKRLTSPERFELKQLIASGVMDIRDHPEYDEQTGLLPEDGDGGAE